jgi:hypothetical protein
VLTRHRRDLAQRDATSYVLPSAAARLVRTSYVLKSGRRIERLRRSAPSTGAASAAHERFEPASCSGQHTGCTPLPATTGDSRASEMPKRRDPLLGQTPPRLELRGRQRRAAAQRMGLGTRKRSPHIRLRVLRHDGNRRYDIGGRRSLARHANPFPFGRKPLSPQRAPAISSPNRPFAPEATPRVNAPAIGRRPRLLRPL